MHFPARPFALLATTLALVASLGLSGALPASADDAGRHGRLHGLPQVHVPKLPAGAADSDGDVQGDATMWARDAVLHGRAASSGPSRFAMPAVMCSDDGHICVHFDPRPTVDGSANPNVATVSFANLVLSTLAGIYQRYASSGYRMPLNDSTSEPGPTLQTDGAHAGSPVPVDATDIYLANIGDQGYYGYCAPTRATNPITTHTMSAFCVLDNDYAEFSDETPENNLRVTAAHEFFHAVQFGYDAYEDPWFMESTAVWMEDEVFTDINGNLQYLRFGPLGRPGQSLDKDTTIGVYGGWIFFRWLTEHRPALVGQLPGLVLSMWQRAAANPTSDRYSLQAVAGAMASAGLPMRTAFARFAADNRNARQAYQEGATNRYPIARPTGSHTLRTRGHSAGSVRIDHLAAATERFKSRTAHKHAKLHLSVDMAAKKYGTDAAVTVFLRGGRTEVRMFHLNGAGRGSLTVPFSSRKVKRVELTMTNASTRMHCWTNGLYSCEGTPRDQNQLERYAAKVRG